MYFMILGVKQPVYLQSKLFASTYDPSTSWCPRKQYTDKASSAGPKSQVTWSRFFHEFPSFPIPASVDN